MTGQQSQTTYPAATRTGGPATQLLARALPRLLNLGPGRERPLPAGAFRPRLPSRAWSVSHYNVVIPDLPAPHLFLACATIQGSTGFKVFDIDHAIQDSPRRTATLAFGTAASTHESFTSYSIPRDCEFQPDGSFLQWGKDLEISGSYPNFRVRGRRPGFGIDLELTATGEHSTYARSFLYTHVGLLTRYTGTITESDRITPVAGLCSFEYACGRSSTVFVDKPLPPKLKVPADFFAWHVITLDDNTQLQLAQASAAGRQALTAAWLPTVGGGRSARVSTDVDYEILSYQSEPTETPDGRKVYLPEIFRWIVRDEQGELFNLIGTVDTQLHYGLGGGHIGGYNYAGTWRGRPIGGRGYIEHADGRDDPVRVSRFHS